MYSNMHLHRPRKQIDLLLNFLLVEERPFSFHSTYILDSLPYGQSAFRKGFPVKNYSGRNLWHFRYTGKLGATKRPGPHSARTSIAYGA
ncbi:hypothetical protein TWF730_008616 [Orbilia blumenaviensis]|uniref:Ribosomal protein L2 n=1 Tax=Orbilia blumenaviensis TaxID=1796055 RepID=A0AAV9V600_9PEZI